MNIQSGLKTYGTDPIVVWQESERCYQLFNLNSTVQYFLDIQEVDFEFGMAVVLGIA